METSNNRGMKDWIVFIRVVEFRSLSRAAKDLNISVAAVSKSLSRLENFVKASLILRDAQNFELTSAGQIAYKQAKDIAQAFRSLLTSLQNPERNIEGRVRLCAPALICELLANHWTLDYVKQNNLSRVLLYSREGGEFSHNSPEFDDLVLKSGFMESEDLIHRKLAPVNLLLCASPGYLDKHNVITHPEDLKSHFLLGINHHWLEKQMILTNGNEEFLLTINNHSKVISNNYLALLGLILNGHGIMILPSWVASEYLVKRLLVSVLPQWKLPAMPVYLVWRHRKFYSPMFRHFAKFIESKWNALPHL
ncbi:MULTISPECIES: LysR family transcriptional regulator [Cedecea]|uniref:LysR family transcriptional regulator n=1 Tax=Cedecea TaxID=158483 RepID=UPI00143EE8D7|nr:MULTISPECIES: LysR family transcriptional regulator [Cedecea]QIX94792.1 LysR family transcriptional regulator [Cedecea sp. FDAARGOS_727]